ncbi:MAG: anthranilate phosphoribosyltransferase [Propionibacterium sp.]|nr:anthranilate phosphoribosyltransferase [Brooklawnia sp. SH051]NLI84044.1 anthranilate phosphoribosyltransferase [Propionibacterium sp.]
MNHTWPDVLTSLVRGEDMDTETTRWAMSEILSGNASAAQMAAFMVALRAKGETVTEIDALASGMLDKATPIELPTDAVDVVGSGGDRANTVNISTMAAIVAAAAGAKVVKHGNRAASSMSGTADCLEALGVALNVPPERQGGIFDECGLVFLFAPLYHSSLRHTAPVRKELGIQTTFNFLGPLANPARPQAQAIGVANLELADLVAGVLAARGNRGMVFHGEDGLDELTTTTSSDIWLISDGQVVRTELDPNDLGVTPSLPTDLVGGKPEHNAQVVRDVFAGATGPVRDIVLVNAAAALLAFDGPSLMTPVAEQLRSKLGRAAAAIDEGKATALLDSWIEATQRAVAAGR